MGLINWIRKIIFIGVMAESDYEPADTHDIEIDEREGRGCTIAPSSPILPHEASSKQDKQPKKPK